jgi:hypothetical protein
MQNQRLSKILNLIFGSKDFEHPLRPTLNRINKNFLFLVFVLFVLLLFFFRTIHKTLQKLIVTAG